MLSVGILDILFDPNFLATAGRGDRGVRHHRDTGHADAGTHVARPSGSRSWRSGARNCAAKHHAALQQAREPAHRTGGLHEGDVERFDLAKHSRVARHARKSSPGPAIADRRR